MVEPGSTFLKFDGVYDEYFSFVWRTLRRLGIPDAALEDVTQEVFFVVYRRLADFRGDSSLKTWIFGIVRRVVRTHRRTKARRPTEPLADREPRCLQPMPDETTERRQAQRILYRLLDTLDDDKREVFVMVEIEGMSCPEIASAIGVNLNTIYSRLRAARQQFEMTLADYRERQGEAS